MDYNKLTKKQSGFIFLIVYVLIFIVGLGIILIWKEEMSAIWLMFIADAVMTTLIFLIGNRFKNASLYDPYWSVIPIYIVVLWMIFYEVNLDIFNFVLLAVILIWGVRLTYNWWKNWHGFTMQDWRYDLLKEKNPKIYPLTNFFGIHMIPTVVVFIQMINVFDSLNSSNANIFLFILGVIFCLIAPAIQFVSDKQMFDFRKNNSDKSKVINVGLWRFSRHPNYFGELMFWVGVYVIYLSKTMTINLNIIYPLLMIMLFVFISIPMMENKIKSREGYSEYKSTVSILFPLPPKKN